MQVSVTEAKGQLTELVRRAEAGDEVILTRHGHAALRLVPVRGCQTGDPAGRCSRRLARPPRRKPRPDRVLRAARISSMAMTACPDDRGRYVGADGDPARRAGSGAPAAQALEAEDELLISAGTVAEALIVAGRRNVGLEMARLIDGLGFEVLSRDAGLGTADRTGLCELGQGRASRSTEFRRLLRLRGGEGARLPAALCGPGFRANRCRARSLNRTVTSSGADAAAWRPARRPSIPQASDLGSGTPTCVIEPVGLIGAWRLVDPCFDMAIPAW